MTRKTLLTLLAIPTALALAAGALLALNPHARTFAVGLHQRIEQRFWNLVDPPVGVAELKPSLMAGGLVVGDREATESIIIFVDYNCPHCRYQVREFDRLAALGQRFKVIVHHAPHSRDSIDLALAILAARRQDGDVALHKAMVSAVGPLATADIPRLAAAAGLDPGRLAEDAAAKQTEDLLDQDIRLGWKLRVKGTPTLVVGDTVIVGATEAEKLAVLLAH